MVKMLKHHSARQRALNTHHLGAKLANNIDTNLKEKFAVIEKMTALSLSTLLDPRYKQLGFCNLSNAQAAVDRLTRECAGFIVPAVPQESVPSVAPPEVQDRNLWGLLDSHVEAEQQAPNATASAIAEVQGYLRDAHLSRVEDPLKYWTEHKAVYPHLFQVAVRYLCTPASSVPCESFFKGRRNCKPKKKQT
ncbi:zinc finger BED domain-containing protein 4-like [Astyanax mexicanus]|uniref:Zinc finger BED domain-containing protein 4-like n=1 Tax=Astyanax mexicanus TaxID=7994 RepID=A0A8T2L892_ASTMX|nr:zinc finger BED domain-containing protein 4-like [Astyanax mexicanus]